MVDGIALYRHGAELVRELSAAPNPAALRKLFEVRTAVWKYPIQGQECFTIGTFGDIELAPEAAFQLVGTAAEIMLGQTDPDLTVTAGFLLLEIIQASQTTQLPESLEQRWDAAIAKLASVTGEAQSDAGIALDAISRWYRRPIRAGT
ncbi:MAG: hypothetical protein ACM359_05365 [Bacillota bacterium]